MTSFVSSVMMRVSISPSSSSPRRKPVSKVRKHTAELKRAMTQRHAANWQRSAIEDAGQSTEDQRKRSKSRGKWEDISHNEKEKKNTWHNSCKEGSKRETVIYTLPESMADEATVEDGDRGRLRKTLKQLRKERDEANEALAFLEEMQQNLDERTPEPLKPNGDCARSLRITCTHGTKKLEDQTTSAPKSGKGCKGII